MSSDLLHETIKALHAQRDALDAVIAQLEALALATPSRSAPERKPSGKSGARRKQSKRARSKPQGGETKT